MAAGEGFEPSRTESESGVLPLHKPAMFRLRCAANIDYYSGKSKNVNSFFEKTSKIFAAGSVPLLPAAVLHLMQQIFAPEILAHGLLQQGREHQHDGDRADHVRCVIQQRIKPGGGHGHAEKGFGHIFAPDHRTDHIVGEEAQQAAQQSTADHGLLAALHQTGTETKHGIGHKIVHHHARPVDGKAIAGDILQYAENKAGKGAPAGAVANGKEDDGQHGGVNGAALGEAVEDDVAEDLRDGDEHRGFGQDSCFGVSHDLVSLSKMMGSRPVIGGGMGQKIRIGHPVGVQCG